MDLSTYVSADQYDLFHTLAKTYERKLEKAELAVQEAEKEAYRGYRQKEYGLVDFNIYH